MDRRALPRILLQPDLPLDSDDRANPLSRQHLGGVRQDLQGLRTLLRPREVTPETALPQLRERISQLRLEDDHRRQHAVSEEDFQQVAYQLQLQNLGERVDGEQHDETDQHLDRARARPEQQQAVEDERHHGDLDEVPESGPQEADSLKEGSAPFDREVIASAMSSARRAAATS